MAPLAPPVLQTCLAREQSSVPHPRASYAMAPSDPRANKIQSGNARDDVDAGGEGRAADSSRVAPTRVSGWRPRIVRSTPSLAELPPAAAHQEASPLCAAAFTEEPAQAAGNSPLSLPVVKREQASSAPVATPLVADAAARGSREATPLSGPAEKSEGLKGKRKESDSTVAAATKANKQKKSRSDKVVCDIFTKGQSSRQGSRRARSRSTSSDRASSESSRSRSSDRGLGRSSKRSRGRSPARAREKGTSERFRQRSPEHGREKSSKGSRRTSSERGRDKTSDRSRPTSPERARAKKSDRSRPTSPERARAKKSDRSRPTSPERGRAKKSDRSRRDSSERERGRSDDRSRRTSRETRRTKSVHAARRPSTECGNGESSDHTPWTSPDRGRPSGSSRQTSPDHTRARSSTRSRRTSPDRTRARSCTRSRRTSLDRVRAQSLDREVRTGSPNPAYAENMSHLERNAEECREAAARQEVLFPPERQAEERPPERQTCVFWRAGRCSNRACELQCRPCRPPAPRYISPSLHALLPLTVLRTSPFGHYESGYPSHYAGPNCGERGRNRSCIWDHLCKFSLEHRRRS
ncbi:hypothetical protein BDK51DRAFT_49274 [Blyttiomyces helicus]|uniref:Uncharacterized protein n=1 Tax=Blyttiomyces helicus TaxID=388810 RepID=A0A4V1IPU2_9FUNG|nr:hypothetical protein BDK51DRAFT_49274 [Blyttiomyces helicus]|eukprot:RKO84247.1 hypothetical protein BDK51DRAFT_49274 [Blyttiomyces helicus]